MNEDGKEGRDGSFVLKRKQASIQKMALWHRWSGTFKVLWMAEEGVPEPPATLKGYREGWRLQPSFGGEPNTHTAPRRGLGWNTKQGEVYKPIEQLSGKDV